MGIILEQTFRYDQPQNPVAEEFESFVRDSADARVAKRPPQQIQIPKCVTEPYLKRIKCFKCFNGPI